MKKMNLVLCAFFMFFLSATVKAQDTTDYFVGKWNVVVYGTPEGDAKMLISLLREEGKLKGAISDTTATKEVAKISSVEEKSDSTITIYFTANGYDVDLTLKKKDDEHVEGSLMAMFNAKGERSKK